MCGGVAWLCVWACGILLYGPSGQWLGCRFVNPKDARRAGLAPTNSNEVAGYRQLFRYHTSATGGQNQFGPQRPRGWRGSQRATSTCASSRVSLDDAKNITASTNEKPFIIVSHRCPSIGSPWRRPLGFSSRRIALTPSGALPLMAILTRRRSRRFLCWRLLANQLPERITIPAKPANECRSHPLGAEEDRPGVFCLLLKILPIPRASRHIRTLPPRPHPQHSSKMAAISMSLSAVANKRAAVRTNKR